MHPWEVSIFEFVPVAGYQGFEAEKHRQNWSKSVQIWSRNRRAENDSMDFKKDAEVDEPDLVLLVTLWTSDRVPLPCMPNLKEWQGRRNILKRKWRNVDGILLLMRLRWRNVIAKSWTDKLHELKPNKSVCCVTTLISHMASMTARTALVLPEWAPKKLAWKWTVTSDIWLFWDTWWNPGYTFHFETLLAKKSPTLPGTYLAPVAINNLRIDG